MTTFKDFFQTLGNYITTIGVADAFDILIVAFLIYQLSRLIRKNNSMRVARGIILLLVMLWLSGILRLTMISATQTMNPRVTMGPAVLMACLMKEPESRRGA